MKTDINHIYYAAVRYNKTDKIPVMRMDSFRIVMSDSEYSFFILASTAKNKKPLHAIVSKELWQ